LFSFCITFLFIEDLLNTLFLTYGISIEDIDLRSSDQRINVLHYFSIEIRIFSFWSISMLSDWIHSEVRSA
jgi:hypothetical protein